MIPLSRSKRLSFDFAFVHILLLEIWFLTKPIKPIITYNSVSNRVKTYNTFILLIKPINNLDFP